MNYPSRKLPRLRDYDYATPGVYFVTICTHEKACIFGRVVPANSIGEAQIIYSPLGVAAMEQLQSIEKHYGKTVKLDHWAIMPNHIHVLIRIQEQTDSVSGKEYDISNVIGKYKAAVTRIARRDYGYAGKIWQPSFYDHVVRNEKDYQEIWRYISGNPSKWLEDKFRNL